jgi:hypothetical protein
MRLARFWDLLPRNRSLGRMPQSEQLCYKLRGNFLEERTSLEVFIAFIARHGHMSVGYHLPRARNAGGRRPLGHSVEGRG